MLFSESAFYSREKLFVVKKINVKALIPDFTWCEDKECLLKYP
jgi:hypothetical protein